MDGIELPRPHYVPAAEVGSVALRARGAHAFGQAYPSSVYDARSDLHDDQSRLQETPGPPLSPDGITVTSVRDDWHGSPANDWHAAQPTDDRGTGRIPAARHPNDSNSMRQSHWPEVSAQTNRAAAPNASAYHTRYETGLQRRSSHAAFTREIDRAARPLVSDSGASIETGADPNNPYRQSGGRVLRDPQHGAFFAFEGLTAQGPDGETAEFTKQAFARFFRNEQREGVVMTTDQAGQLMRDAVEVVGVHFRRRFGDGGHGTSLAGLHFYRTPEGRRRAVGVVVGDCRYYALQGDDMLSSTDQSANAPDRGRAYWVQKAAAEAINGDDIIAISEKFRGGHNDDKPNTDFWDKRHEVGQLLDGQRTAVPDVWDIPVDRQDGVAVFSKGVTDNLTNTEIKAYWQDGIQAGRSAQAIADSIVRFAEARSVGQAEAPYGDNPQGVYRVPSAPGQGVILSWRAPDGVEWTKAGGRWYHFRATSGQMAGVVVKP